METAGVFLESNVMKTHCLIRFRRMVGDERGNVSIFLAFSLGLLVFAVALAFDLSLLSIEKNRLQHAVEAATLASMRNLQNGHDAVADDVAAMLAENGVNNVDTEVQIGYYDAYERHADFSVYRDFLSAETGALPDGLYPNAVMVIVREKLPTIAVGSGDAGEGGVAVSAVAYLREYGFMALGSSGGIKTKNVFTEGYSCFQACPLHSNADIKFSGTEGFEGKSPVTATGLISNGPGSSGAPAVHIPGIDWDGLREEADVILYPQEWEEGVLEETEMFYYGRVGHPLGSHLFLPKDGDHNGVTYYFALNDPNSSPSFIRLYTNMDNLYGYDDYYDEKWHAYNFTIACEGHYSIGIQYNYMKGIRFGNPGDEHVEIYTRGRIFLQDRADTEIPGFEFNGVVFRTEGQFTYYSHAPQHLSPCELRIRIFADQIELRGGWASSNSGRSIFNPQFAPWYSPLFPKLGTLVSS